MQLLSSFQPPHCTSEAAVKATKKQKQEAKIAVILQAPPTTTQTGFLSSTLREKYEN